MRTADLEVAGLTSSVLLLGGDDALHDTLVRTGRTVARVGTARELDGALARYRPTAVVIAWEEAPAPAVMASLAPTVAIVAVIAGPEMVARALSGGAHEVVLDGAISPPALEGALVAAAVRAARRPAEESTLAGDVPELELALELSRTGVWDWDLTTGLVRWTLACHEILGVDRARFSGELGDVLALVHPHDLGPSAEVVRQAVVEGRPFVTQCRVVRPDGRTVWVQNSGRGLYGPGGAPVRVMGTVVDITARVATDAEVAQRARQFQNLAENSPALIARFDRRGAIAYANTRVMEVTGRSRSDVLGTTALQLAGSDEGKRWDRAIAEVLRSGQPAALELSLRTERGARSFDVTIVPDVDAGGTFDHVLSVASDVTERKDAELALKATLSRAERAVQTRDDLLQVVSHDLKNPLNSLLLGVNLLREHVPAAATDVLRIVAQMGNQVRRMDRLVTELTEAAQLHSGEPLELRLESADLGTITRSLIIDHQAASPRHRFDVSGVPEVVAGVWDIKRLERAFNNLIANAVKYSPKGGTITVRVVPAGSGWVQWSIRDPGIGIGPHDRERIFEWFSRGENARRAAIKGMGIGLAAVRQIIHEHGGHVTVESEPGQGATFTVHLPRLALPYRDEVRPPTAGGDATPPPLSRMN